ncbi:MAG: ribbon-helix-helix domain-containing protein [candidate division NC10 bacterium]|nr:ribbon-helix-helix domain-containing protein [candidate division NC10 bacterium]
MNWASGHGRGTSEPIGEEEYDMARERLKSPVSVLTMIETSQHEALRLIAFNERISVAELVREGIDEVIRKHGKSRKPVKVTVAATDRVKAAAAR